MKRKLIAILVGTAVLGLSGQAVAQSTMKPETAAKGKAGTFRAADVNHDGMLSREEFMKFHETTWERMKRNAGGMAMMDDVEAMYRPGTVPSAIPGEPRTKAKP